MDLAEIGSVILTNRKLLGLSQKALADRARVSRYTVIKLENNNASDIQFKTLGAILSVLRLTLSVSDMPVSGIRILGQDS